MVQHSNLTQITKIFSVAVIVLAFSLQSCGNGSSDETTFRDWCRTKTDSLWTVLSATRQNFNYQMDEIAERREEMDSILKVLKFAEEGKLAEADKSVINQYHSVFTVYKPVSNTYKNAVLEAEDHFYRLKRLEKSVKAGEFDKKQEEFKKTYADLQREVLENAARAKEVSNRLKAVEPMYLRLEPKIEEILERTAP